MSSVQKYVQDTGGPDATRERKIWTRPAHLRELAGKMQLRVNEISLETLAEYNIFGLGSVGPCIDKTCLSGPNPQPCVGFWVSDLSFSI